MKLSNAHSTAQVIRLDAAVRARMRGNRRVPPDFEDAFWLEVSSRYALENATPVNGDNRSGRVLGEIALLFAVIGALTFAIWAFLLGGISS
jgi:hypothetical protein